MGIPRFFEQALQGQPISVYGDGKQSRDFIYVDDSVEATLGVADAVRGCEIINVAQGRDIAILDLARRIVELSGSASEVHCIEPPPGRYDFEVQRRCGNSEKLLGLTGFSFKTPFEEGLERTYQHLKTAFAAPGAKSAAE